MNVRVQTGVLPVGTQSRDRRLPQGWKGRISSPQRMNEDRKLPRASQTPGRHGSSRHSLECPEVSSAAPVWMETLFTCPFLTWRRPFVMVEGWKETSARVSAVYEASVHWLLSGRVEAG